jgi:hypothetical protein
MKACVFSVALMCGAVAVSASLAAERSVAPAPAAEGHVEAKPAENADGHQAPAPGGSEGGANTPADAAGERPHSDGHDESVSKAVKPDAETPPSGPTHAHGPRQSTGRSPHEDNARPSNPIDTRITVNQGRTLQNNKKGPVQKQEGPSEKTSRANLRKGIHLPHSATRSGAVHGPTRNAIGVAPDANPIAPRVGAAAFPGTGGVKSPATGLPGTNSSGVRREGGSAAAGGVALGSGAGAPRIGHPVVPGSASISGTGVAHGGLRVGEIGGPAKNNGGINGSSVRSKRP